MPSSKFMNSPTPTVGQQENLKVNCYIRSTVPTAIAETIDTIVERLQRLCDHGHITNCQVSPWPPEYHAATETNETHESTRQELVAEFNRWAKQDRYSLEPAFRQQETPPSPLGPAELREQGRVPLVALALYEDGTTTDTKTLRGVIPYSEQSPTGDKQTYTVDDWLTAVETEGDEKVTRDAQADRRSPLEGQQ
ncbi:HTH domain-containing protein [Natronorubrum sp. FCH18a]|uniref:HTH domain-containing protein n=1 Tax=Natronorubrum sp. FCH18a TaxID=3447018 RepID=UPI003F51933A